MPVKFYSRLSLCFWPKVLSDPKLGFRVTKYKNLDPWHMKSAVDVFVNDVNKSPGIALLYFAGHGFQLDGAQYLVPVRMSGKVLDSEIYLAREAFELHSQFANKIKGAVPFIVVDACRHNGLLGGSRGSASLSTIPTIRGSYQVFSTGQGTVPLVLL